MKEFRGNAPESPTYAYYNLWKKFFSSASARRACNVCNMFSVFLEKADKTFRNLVTVLKLRA